MQQVDVEYFGLRFVALLQMFGVDSSTSKLNYSAHAGATPW